MSADWDPEPVSAEDRSAMVSRVRPHLQKQHAFTFTTRAGKIVASSVTKIDASGLTYFEPSGRKAFLSFDDITHYQKH